MIPKATILEIQRALSERMFSHRKIALRIGVSRSTVNNVANGKRTVFTIYQSGCDKTETGVQYFRCPTCGARVAQPCLACLVQRFPRRFLQDDGPMVLGLELEPEHYERYLKVKAERQASLSPCEVMS